MGIGVDSQLRAQETWLAAFGRHLGLEEPFAEFTVADPATTRQSFLTGRAGFAALDLPLTRTEIRRAASQGHCRSGILQVPVSLNPVALIHHVDGVDPLRLSPTTVAAIFSGHITRWDDHRIRTDNPGSDLPDLALTPVHRSSASLATRILGDYLRETTNTWPHPSSSDFPENAGPGAESTADMLATINSTDGAIGYVELSSSGDLPLVHLVTERGSVEPSVENAARHVATHPRRTQRDELAQIVRLSPRTTTEDAYPLVSVSYLATCEAHPDPGTTQRVLTYLDFVLSPTGQEVATGDIGASPLDDVSARHARRALGRIHPPALIGPRPTTDLGS